MLDKTIFITFLISILSIYSINGSKSYCNIPKECQVIVVTKRQLPTDQKLIKCVLNDDTRLRFNQSNDESKSCQPLNKNETQKLIIRPGEERSFKLKKGIIDFKDLFSYIISFHKMLEVMFELFSGFEANLLDNVMPDEITGNFIFKCTNCKLDFYSGDKLLRSCEDFKQTKNLNSIFQLFKNQCKGTLEIVLSETNDKICPLAFKDFRINTFKIYGKVSYFSRSLITFSPERFENLNSSIENLEIFIDNVDLDFDFLHPSVFKSLSNLYISTVLNKINPDLFLVLNSVTHIFLKLEYMRSLFHKNGIEWIKNLNKDINCNLNNSSQVIKYIRSGKPKYIHHDFDNKPLSPSLIDVFPDEDFCLYKDFPINQLVVIFKSPETFWQMVETEKTNFGCTYLWITRSYKDLVNMIPNYTILSVMMNKLLDSDDYKSISRCNFEEKLKRCNFTHENPHITTFFEIGETMSIIEVVLNPSSFVLSIVGIVSNILIIVTVSSKVNKADFKEFKQYDYLRLNSICNCLILIIHMTTWLNQCIYPFQVFCPIIRKTIFMQYFKIVVQDVLKNAFQFMNSFTYIGFAFNRISLIGKDHNKLVKFICDISIRKFIGVSLFISVTFSMVKFFEYDINHGIAVYSYPISYDYINSLSPYVPKILFFLLDFISDLLNHFVLLIVNLAIDIGMIIKLRQTLNERYEKFKIYSTDVQLEKKKSENDNVLDNAISMVIFNSSLNLLLKLPTSSYSLIYLYYSIRRNYIIDSSWDQNFNSFDRFFRRFCIEANFCNLILKLAEFLYLLSISVQFLFYKHYDKKLNSAIKKKFGFKKNIRTALFSYFNLINVLSSPKIENEKLENKKPIN